MSRNHNHRIKTMINTAPSPIVSADAAAWDRDDWLANYEGAAYECSVIWAADGDCLLSESNAYRLFDHHDADAMEYKQELAELAAAGKHCLPWQHAGQCLAWLGY